MRNILALVAIFQFLSLIASGQDIDKIRKDFEDKLTGYDCSIWT